MPLNLHPKALHAARTELANGLPHIQVNHGKSIDGFTAFLATFKANASLPRNGKLHDLLIEYIDEYPLTEFVVETLRRELADTEDYKADVAKCKLTEIEGYGQVEETAARLIALFDSLPWKYTYSIPFTSGLIPLPLLEESQIQIGPGSKITQADLLMSTAYPLQHDNPKVQERIRGNGMLGLGIGNRTWKQDSAYYQVVSDGFIGIYGGGSMTSNAERKIESFLGLGLATKLFSYHYQYENPKSIPEWVVHKLNNGAWEFDSKFELNEEIARVLRHMVPFRFSSDYAEQRRIPWLKSTLEQSNGVFSAKGGESLLLASKWFFDSFKGSDSTLSYVRMMTTLEILLGEHADTSKASLGEILGNRLAYLIGTSHKDRADILSDFKKVYGVRSGILHHGKHRLRGEEREYISRLRTYCERAIQAEARLLLA